MPVNFRLPFVGPRNFAMLATLSLSRRTCASGTGLAGAAAVPDSSRNAAPTARPMTSGDSLVLMVAASLDDDDRVGTGHKVKGALGQDSAQVALPQADSLSVDL